MKDPANKEGFVKIKMPKYYIAKHSDQDLHAAVLAERELCAKLCEAEGARIDASWESCAAAIRARGDMSTKSQNSDTSAERVHESDKSIHEPWNTSDMAHRSGGLSVEQAERKPVKSFSGGVPWYATDAPINEEIEILKAEVKRLQELAEYRLKLLMQMPENKPWVSLTDEEIDEAIESCKTTDTYKYFRAIEAKLKEKNT